MVAKRPGTVLLTQIGTVVSRITDRASAPRQPDEGGSKAALVIDEAYRAALDGLAVGDRVVIVTWLHEADRTVLTTHPRDDATRRPLGVFATRSPDRPNPIGMHETTIAALDGATVHLTACEAIDGTPVLDIKPVLGPIDAR